jgi:putative endonuclease
MFTVYVLYSEKYDKIYVGFTSDLEARLKSHNQLSRKGWTVRYRPWEIIYTETYADKQSAMRRERALKSSQGRKFIRSLLQ